MALQAPADKPAPRATEAMREAALEMYEALEGVINYEMQSAKYMGFSDCTCMNRSRDAEISYETGTCPHQIARAALAKASRT